MSAEERQRVDGGVDGGVYPSQLDAEMLKRSTDRNALTHGVDSTRVRSWTESVQDSTETIDESIVIPTNESGTKSTESDDKESDDGSISSVVARDADDELTPSPGSKRRDISKTKDTISADSDCQRIAEMVKEMMKVQKSSGNPGTSRMDPPTIDCQVVDDSSKPLTNINIGGKEDSIEVGFQKNHPISAIFAEIKGKLPSPAVVNDDGLGSSRARENSVFASSAKAPMAASAAMVTGLKKWQIRSKTSDETNTFTKHPTHMACIRANWDAERTRLPFPIVLQIQQEIEPILQNIVRTYKSVLGPKHKLTLQAIDKLEKLKVQLHGDDVYT